MTIVEAPLPQNNDLHRRQQQPRAIVIHTTGRGLAGRAAQIAHAEQLAEDRRHAASEMAALGWYRSGGWGFYGGYLVGPAGGVYRLAPDEIVTWHSGLLSRVYLAGDWRDWAHPLGGSGWVKHGRDGRAVFDWWDARWPDLKAPIDLVTGRSPNAVSIGIDLLPTLDGRYTLAQTAACAELVSELCDEHAIPHDRRHVLGHEDVDPCERGTILRGGKILGVPWDPGSAFDWSALGLAVRPLPEDLTEPRP